MGEIEKDTVVMFLAAMAEESRDDGFVEMIDPTLQDLSRQQIEDLVARMGGGNEKVRKSLMSILEKKADKSDKFRLEVSDRFREKHEGKVFWPMKSQGRRKFH